MRPLKSTLCSGMAMGIRKKNRTALIIGFVIFGFSILAGIYSSVIKWAGPNPKMEFFLKTDLSRIYQPSLFAPPVLTFILFPISIPILLIAGALMYYGLKREFRVLTILSFIILGIYWYGMVDFAWRFD